MAVRAARTARVAGSRSRTSPACLIARSISSIRCAHAATVCRSSARSAPGPGPKSSLATSDSASASSSTARRARRTMGASTASRSSMTSMACSPCGPAFDFLQERSVISSKTSLLAASTCSRRPAAGRNSSRNSRTRSRISTALGWRCRRSGSHSALAVLVQAAAPPRAPVAGSRTTTRRACGPRRSARCASPCPAPRSASPRADW